MGSEGIGDSVTGKWRKEDPCHLGAETLAGFCLQVQKKAKLANDENGNFSEEISKQSDEGAARFLPVA